MSVIENVVNDLKTAMKARDQLRVDALRDVRANVMKEEVAQAGTLDDAQVLAVIKRLVKQRNEAISQYLEGEREDLADKERKEKEILSAYLPAAPSEAALEAAVDAVFLELAPQGMKDMGRVMQACNERLDGVDGKVLSTRVKAKLLEAAK